MAYGILKHLPCTHHFLATLYTHIMSEHQSCHPLWQASNVTLIYKRNEPDNPASCRMIALTSVVGKLFHQIISDRILDYMTAISFIDTSMQKTYHITLFDLKVAFGSISHSLIDHTLTRYNIPEKCEKVYHIALLGYQWLSNWQQMGVKSF